MAPVLPGSTVAVTGASGYIGSHVCAALVQAGYRVRAVVRDPSDEQKIAHLKELPGASGTISFFAGELLQTGSYNEALAGADAVVHAAAIVEINSVSDPEAEIVRPSIDGVRNVLASADSAGSIRRFIHISSILAATSFDSSPSACFSECDWNQASTASNGDPYGFAKTAAEREVHSHAGTASYDIICLNPGVCLGPVFCKAHTKASVVVVRQMLYGNPQPSYKTAFVDVRDVAEANVISLGLEGVSEVNIPRRFLICSDTQQEVTTLQEPLRRLFPEYHIDAVNLVGQVQKSVLAAPIVWRIFTSEFRRSMLFTEFTYDNSLSKKELKLAYRPLDETLRDSVKSMVELGFVKPRLKK